MHYGLLPRANRGIFAINELPDLAGKIQVGLFNILQEGDVQIKGYPIRLPLDILIAFTANPEDYTARGKIITPLKDRIGSEIRTHYPTGRADAMAITAQEAWLARNGASGAAEVPAFVAEIVEEIAFQARQDRRVDKRSGVSQRLPISAMENVVSNAERRALASGEQVAVARVTDVYAALPSITGKFEMEYEGELKGAEAVARDLIRASVATVADGYLSHLDTRPIIEWFDLGGSLQLSDTMSAADVLGHARQVQGLLELARPRVFRRMRQTRCWPPESTSCSKGCTRRRRSVAATNAGYHGAEPPVRKPAREVPLDEETRGPGSGRKKYYN